MVAIRIGVGQYQDPKSKRRINAVSEDAADKALKLGKYAAPAAAKPAAKPAAPKPTESEKPAVFPGGVSTTAGGDKVDLTSGGGIVDAQAGTTKDFVTGVNPIINPALQSNAGGTRSITYDESGHPIITDTLSGGNQSVLSGLQSAGTSAGNDITSLLNGGIFGSLTNPAGAGPAPTATTPYQTAPLTQPGGTAPDAQAGTQSNFEKAMFDKLMYGQDRAKKQEGEQLEQTLANRGIPVGSTAYSNAMKDFNDRYDTYAQNARNNAVTSGQQLAQGALGSLSQVQQAGFYNPTFQQFQTANPGSPLDMGQLAQIFGQFSLGQQGAAIDAKQAETQRKAAEAAAALAARRGTGGARPQGTPQSTAFSTQPLPGTGAP